MKDKVSNVHKTKLLNMRTLNYIFVFGFFFLLFFTSVKATTIFNISTNIATEVPISTETTLIHYQKVFCGDTYCYHFYTARAGYLGYIAKYLKNSTYPFTAIDIGYTEISKVLVGEKAIDIIEDGSNFYAVFMNTSKLINRYSISKTDLSITRLSAFTPPVYSVNGDNDFSLASDKSAVFTNYSTSGVQHGIWYLFENDTIVRLTIPIQITMPSDLNWIYLSSIDEYWLLLRNETKAYLFRYGGDAIKNHGDYMFINYYQISTGTVVGKDTYASYNYNPPGSLFAFYNDDFVYFILRQYEGGHTPEQHNNTYMINGISVNDVHSSGSYIDIGEQFLNLTSYDSFLGNDTYETNNQSIAMSMFYANNKWNFIYQQQDADQTYNGHKVKTFSEYSTCLCSLPATIGSCGDYAPNQQKYNQTCSPSGCNITTWFTDCTPTAPEVHYETVPYCKICNPADMPEYTSMIPWWNEDKNTLYAGIHGNTFCNAPAIEIPTSAVNITSVATLKLVANTLGTAPDENFNITVCNPIISGHCSNAYLSCQDNSTFSYSLNYDSYTAGETATASFGVNGVNKCNGFLNGWGKFDWSGTLCVYITQLCGGFKCSTINGITYEDYYDTTCTYKNRTACNTDEYCIANTGCTSTIGGTGGITSQDPFSLFFSYTNKVFTSDTPKIFLSVMITGGVVAYIVFSTKDRNIGVMTGMGMILFFLYLGWLPAFIGLLWIISVALLVADKFIGKGKK